MFERDYSINSRHFWYFFKKNWFDKDSLAIAKF